MLSTVGLICLHSVARRRRPPSVARCRVGAFWTHDTTCGTKMTNLHVLIASLVINSGRLTPFMEYPLFLPSFFLGNYQHLNLTSTSKSDSPVFCDNRTRRVSRHLREASFAFYFLELKKRVADLSFPTDSFLWEFFLDHKCSFSFLNEILFESTERERGFLFPSFSVLVTTTRFTWSIDLSTLQQFVIIFCMKLLPLIFL